MASSPVDPSREFAELREQHQAVLEILRVLESARGDLQPVLDMVAETAGRLSGAENCYLWLADGDTLRVEAAYGGTPETLAYERAHPHQGAEAHTLTGRVVKSRNVVGIPDVFDDHTYHWGGQPVQGYRALLGVPIIAGDELVGVLGISWLEPQVFTEDQIRLVSGICGTGGDGDHQRASPCCGGAATPGVVAVPVACSG